MDCKHEKILSRNCELFCLSCGAKLPVDWQTRMHPSAAEKPAETHQEMLQKPAKRTTKKKEG